MPAFNTQNGAGLSAGRLTGDLGPIRDFNDAAAVVTGEVVDAYTSVFVTGRAERGTGFMSVNSWGSSLKSLPAGSYDVGTPSAESGVYVIVCSDSNDGLIHFDANADEATITVTDLDDGQRRVDVTSEVPDGEGLTTQTASFVFAL